MEFAFGRSGLEGRLLKQEKRSESSDDDDDVHPKQDNNIHVQVASMEDTTATTAYSTKKEEAKIKLESAKAEMGEVREENERLKQRLERVMKDYKSLQMKFQDIAQKDTKHHHHQHNTTMSTTSHDEEYSECDLVCDLSLGRSVLPSIRNNIIGKGSDETSQALLMLKDDHKQSADLALGLDCKSGIISCTNNNNNVPNISSSSPVNSSADIEAPSNNNKVVREIDAVEDEVSQLNNSPAKKPRVCVRARCDTPTMNDGCQWRKYGQKIAKGNPCPRAYYRCTVAPSCPVRKQVQRCAEDMSILITTYEGNHNHPLPLSATAMASTTSAAASMVLSGSLPTSSTAAATTTACTDLHGLNNFYLSNTSKSKQIYLSNPTSSSSHSHPTITLDLTTTATTNPLSSRIFTSNYYNPPRSSSSSLYHYHPSSSSSTSFNFSHPNHSINRSSVFNSINLARPTLMENVYRHLPNYMQKNCSTINIPPSHALPADTIAAATEAITADPKFHSALAVALTSIINGAGSGAGT